MTHSPKIILLTLLAPITPGGNFARFQGFSVSLMGAGSETQGVILVNGVRSVDSLDSDIVGEVLAILSAILD